MICKACGYEHEEKWDSNKRQYIRTAGADPFIVIRGTFIVEYERDYAPSEKDEINLYACPECYTIKMKGRFE